MRNGFERVLHQSIVKRSFFFSSRPAPVVACVFFLLMTMPYASAYSGLAWAGVVDSEQTMGTTSTYSPNGDFLASGHKNSVVISNSITQAVEQEILVDFPVESIEFTSDSRYLIVGMESELPNTPAVVVFEYIEGDFQRARHTEDGKNVDAISVTANNALFATATEEGKIAEWHMDTGSGSNLDVYREFPQTHVGHITCIDHSMDGQHMISGAEDGVVIIWDRSNQTEITRWETNAPIADCSFSAEGGTMAWISGGSLYLRHHDSTFSYAGQFDISVHSSQLEFDGHDSKLAILVDEISDSSRRIDFVNATSLPIVIERTLYLPHKSFAFSLHPSLNKVAVSTGSEYVAIYADHVQSETEIPLSIDTDQDNIPDTIDTDDDGDGILDVYDNICPSGNNCHLKPDQNFMRNVRIEIDQSTVVISDTIHLDPYQSSYIRKLVAGSHSEPVRVDQIEYDHYLFSMCDEYRQEEVISRWSNHLQFENSTFIPSGVTCRIDSGLYGTMNSDTGSRISITWVIDGVSTKPLVAPYNVSIVNNLHLPSSSVAQVVHTFPIRIDILDTSGMTFTEEIWHRRDANIEAHIVIPPAVEPTEIESILDILIEYWYGLILLAICVGVLAYTMLIRSSNRIDFSELSNEDSFEDDWEEMVDDAAAWEEDMDIPVRKRKPKPPAAVMKDIRRKPTPPAEVQADLEQNQISEAPKRRVKRTKTSVEDLESDSEIGFSHLIKNNSQNESEEIVEENEMMEDALSFITSNSGEKKKRRPARRKKSD